VIAGEVIGFKIAAALRIMPAVAHKAINGSAIVIAGIGCWQSLLNRVDMALIRHILPFQKIQNVALCDVTVPPNMIWSPFQSRW
jgi:hypothetical protein